MYNSLLTKVIHVVKTARHEPVSNGYSEQYNYLFNPEEWLRMQNQKIEHEKRTNQIIAGVTALAVVGELYHLAKRSNMLKKLIK